MNTIKILACVILAAGPLFAAASKEKKMAEKTVNVASKEGRFSCTAPADWARSADERTDKLEGVHGFFLAGPKGASEFAARMSVDYYAPGNKLFAASADFLKANLEPPFKVDGEKTSPVSPARVGGLAAKRFTREHVVILPPAVVTAKRVKAKDEIVVVEGESGFWVLTYSAAQPDFKRLRPAFAKLLETFKTE